MARSDREAYAWCHECGFQKKVDIAALIERVGGDYSLINRRTPCPECGAPTPFHFRQAGLYPMWDRDVIWVWERADRKRQAGMCNRYEVYLNGMKKLFGQPLEEVLRGINLPSNEVNPGGQGVVWCGGDRIHKMDWGFTTPKFSKRDPTVAIKPAIWNNARSENLHIPLWRESFAIRRCVIPVTRFCEAEGNPGNMTRTWFSVPRGDYGFGDHFAVGGIWREEKDGLVFSMVMTSSAPPVRRIHDRMPVILAPDKLSTWLDGSPEEAKSLCLPWQFGLAEDRTAERWYRPSN